MADQNGKNEKCFNSSKERQELFSQTENQPSAREKIHKLKGTNTYCAIDCTTEPEPDGFEDATYTETSLAAGEGPSIPAESSSNNKDCQLAKSVSSTEVSTNEGENAENMEIEESKDRHARKNDEETENEDTEDEAVLDEDDDATDVEYYEKSYKGTLQEAWKSNLKGTEGAAAAAKSPAKIKRAGIETCLVCGDSFPSPLDLHQHLTKSGCQLDNNQMIQCNMCNLETDDVEAFKHHYASHLDGFLMTCLACGTKFPSKWALEKHMFVDTTILDRLRSNQQANLPDQLCRTVVDILVEDARLPNSPHRACSKPGFYLDVEDQAGEGGKRKKLGRRVRLKGNGSGEDASLNHEEEEEEEEEEVEEDEDEEELVEEEEEEEDCNESNLQSEIEQDLDEAEEDSEEEEGEELNRITRPFLSSSLTDAPRTPFPPDLNNDDSVTSQSQNSVEETADASASAVPSSSSRRKSKRPMQVQRAAAAPTKARKVTRSSIRLRPKEEEETVLRGGMAIADSASLVCTMCGDSLPDKHKLELHVDEHEKNFPFFCALCDSNFMEGRLLQAHIASCHSASQALQCKMCGMYFKLRGSLVTHTKFCREAPACVVCGETFKSGTELEKHYYNHSMEERSSAEFLSCGVCGEVFVSTMQLRQHQKWHGATRPFSCELCAATFTQQKALDKHRQVHYRQHDCKCEICGAQLLTRSGLVAHLRGHKNNESVHSLELSQKMLAVLEEKNKRLGARNKAGDACGGGDTGAGGVVDTKDLTLDTAQYLKLIEEHLQKLEGEDSKHKPKALRRPSGTKGGSHMCSLCDQFFSSADRFQAHMRRSHKDEVEFEECDICQRQIYGKEYLLKHQRKHSSMEEGYACDQCSKVFRRKHSLETHRKIHTFRKFVKCDICGEEFRFVSEVDKHKHRVHKYDRSQASYQCNVCRMKFATLSHLSIHCSHSHKPSEGKPFKCQSCHTLFATCVELKKHIYCSHESTPCTGVPIKEEPQDTYEDGDGKLYTHMKDYVQKIVGNLQSDDGSGQNTKGQPDDGVGDDNDDYEDEDSVGVTAYNELTRHKMSHTNMARRFICETCHKSFATKSDLRTHIRTHTGETPYKCDYCDRAFKQRGHRKLHIQVAHTKDMPYTCDLCHQSYPTRYRYQIHLKRHTGIKEHQCQHCDKAYYTVGKLNEHKRKHHMAAFVAEQAGKDK